MISLTVVIPTFNRSKILVNGLTTFLSQLAEIQNIRVAIFDNASSDDTVEQVQNVISHLDYEVQSKVSIFKQENNIGFSGNLLSAINLVSTEWIMFLSDEDVIHPKPMLKLMAYLESAPHAFICPVCVNKSGVVMRGSNQLKSVPVEELDSASNYISGLCYRVSAIRRSLDFVIPRFESRKFFILYPQLIITFTIAVVLCESLGYFPYVITSQNYTEETAIKASAEPYWFVKSRWDQLVDQLDIFSYFVSQAKSVEQLSESTRLLNWFKSDIYRQIRAGVDAELGIGDLLDKSALFFLTRNIAR
jgi:glycosyltransferase involved in cell wall biosynthesis